VIGVNITDFRHYFQHCGIRIDPDYDESPPLTKEEQEEMNRNLRKMGFIISEDVGD